MKWILLIIIALTPLTSYALASDYSDCEMAAMRSAHRSGAMTLPTTATHSTYNPQALRWLRLRGTDKVRFGGDSDRYEAWQTIAASGTGIIDSLARHQALHPEIKLLRTYLDQQIYDIEIASCGRSSTLYGELVAWRHGSDVIVLLMNHSGTWRDLYLRGGTQYGVDMVAGGVWRRATSLTTDDPVNLRSSYLASVSMPPWSAQVFHVDMRGAY